MDFFKENFNKDSKRLVFAWLFFAVSSLIFAGIFAFLVAMARTPLIQDILPGKDYIHVALVGHVILSVVIWFLAFQGVLWILTSTGFLNARIFSQATGWLGFWLCVIGTACIVITAILGLGTPLFINYIPVLTHPLFYAGLLLLTFGVSVTLFNTFLTIWKSWKKKTYPGRFPIITFGTTVSGLAVFISVSCFVLSYYFQIISPDSRGSLDFETLFWGGGHILQFANTIAMVTVWIFLTNIVFKTFPIKDSYGKILYAFYLFFVLPSPLLYFIYDTASQEYRDAFTILMQYGLGPSTGLFAIALLSTIGSTAGNTSKKWKGLLSRFKSLPWKDPAFSSLIISMIVFALGGLISLTISGSDVRIPSHYHGVIGGVTLAFMGLTCHILYVLKKDIYCKRISSLQPYIYGIGQTLFVIGMFLAGAHGVQRKTFGSAQNLDDISKIIGMSIVGLGGIIAIAGGIMFVTNSILSLLKHSKEA
jgi:heme/copper-type cytochrome/quinol oxidase subunit 1